jgi:polyphenol oxidase
MTEDISPITHPLLEIDGVSHGFFTRRGGVSPIPYDSLNTGLGSKDTAENVNENRRRVAAYFGQSSERLIGPYQVHSPDCLVVDGPWPTSERPQADGLVTKTQHLIVSALSADCAPILFADPENLVIGACHAGWKGALSGIIEATVEAMRAQGAETNKIRAVIGPCIGQKSYEVGSDYEARFVSQDKDAGAFFTQAATADKRYFDLPAYCLMRLARCGLGQIAATGHDTCADAARFFSNRRAFKQGEADYGRLISSIVLV